MFFAEGEQKRKPEDDKARRGDEEKESRWGLESERGRTKDGRWTKRPQG